MTDKSLLIPDYTRRTLKLEVTDRERLYSVKTYHLRADGNKLVCAEGSGYVCPLPAEAALVRNSEGLIYAANELGELSRYDGKTFVSAGGIMNIRAITSFTLKDGEKRIYALSEAGVYIVEDLPVFIADAGGGVCAAVHYERLFTAQGYRVRYSKALEPENWIESAQGAGFLDLHSAGGNILAAIPYKEKLYLFRERGITQLRALGDNLNFKAVTLPYACGKLAAGSVVNCGESILFFSESGLFSFNGGVCVLLTDYAAGQIDLTQPISAVCAGGKYYAAVTLVSGEKCIFCADVSRKEGHFIAIPAESLIGGEELFFSVGNAFYRLAARGLPFTGECRLEIGKSSFGLSDSNKFLDAIMLEGEGNFTVRAFGERYSSCAAEGRAGERLVFTRPVRGKTFTLHVSCADESAELRTLRLSVREENKFGY